MASSSERTAWRLVKTKFLESALDGEGARRYGGRWNSPGVPVVYLAGSASLAVLEVLVHLGATGPLGAYSLVPVSFPAAFVSDFDRATLPTNWAEYPAGADTQRLGDSWVSECSSAILAVPSVVVPEEQILILNPRHPEAGRLKVEPARRFEWDRRLVG